MKHFLKDYFNIASLPLVLNVTSNNRAAVALYKNAASPKQATLNIIILTVLTTSS